MFFFHFDVVLVAELLPLFGATTQYILFVLCAVWTKRERAESTLAILPFSVGRIIRPIFFAPNVCFFFHFFFLLFSSWNNWKKNIAELCRRFSLFLFVRVSARATSFFAHRRTANAGIFWSSFIIIFIVFYSIAFFSFHISFSIRFFFFVLHPFSVFVESKRLRNSNGSRNAIYCWKIVRETYFVRCANEYHVVNVSWFNEPNIVCLLIHLWTN